MEDADVMLCTKMLESDASFVAEGSTPHGLVAQWRAYQDLLRKPF